MQPLPLRLHLVASKKLACTDYDEKGRIQSFKRESTLEKIGNAQEQWIIDLIRSKRSSPQARARTRGDNDISGTLSSDKLKVVPRERFRHKKVGRLVDTDSAAVASERVDASMSVHAHNRARPSFL